MPLRHGTYYEHHKSRHTHTRKYTCVCVCLCEDGSATFNGDAINPQHSLFYQLKTAKSTKATLQQLFSDDMLPLPLLVLVLLLPC